MQILIGSPVTGSEATVLRKLHDCVKSRNGLLLVNFYVGDRQFDYVAVLEDYTASIELKSVRGAIFGGQNGDWSIKDLTGTKRVYVGFNPWRQAHEQALALSDEMRRYQLQNPRVPAALGAAFYREFDTIACINPRIESGSQFDVTAFKARVLGLDDVLSALQTARRKRSWTIDDWWAFATNSLKLRPVSFDEAIDVRVYEAHRTIEDFRRNVANFYKASLPPLVETRSVDIRGEKLIEILSQPLHQVLIGPSGSTKSFHLRHLVATLSKQGNETPIPFESRTYDGSDLSSHLQKSISPFTQRPIKPLLTDLTLAAYTPVLVVDGINECPEVHRRKLIEKLQAFALHFDARIILSAQNSVSLPPDLCCRETQIGLPEEKEKVQIFACYAGQPPTEALAHKAQSFTNAFDLRLAGLCYSRGANPTSRWELYSRYVRDTLEDFAVVGGSFLRSIAAEMREELVFAIRRDRFVSLAETFFQREATPLASVQKLLWSRLIVTGDDYVSFEHELLLDYFRVDGIMRDAPSVEALASQLERPRNKRLLEFALGHSVTPDEVTCLLNHVDDVTTLSSALRGNCGPVVMNVIREQCSTLMREGLRELSKLTIQCQTVVDEAGRKRLVGLNIEGSDRRSKLEVLLCAVIVENLDDEEVREGAMSVIRAMDTTFLDIVCSAADAAGITIKPAIDEALREYGGFSQYSGGALIGSGLLSSIRYARMLPERTSTPLPVLPLLIEAAYSAERNHFSMFTALIELQHGLHDIGVEELRRFAERGWKTGLSWMRTESVRLLSSLHHQACAMGDDEVAEVCALLQSFETNDILVNTELLEALAAYDGYDRPVSTESAYQEMIELIEASDEPTPAQKEMADAYTTTWARYRRDAAEGCLGKIFESVFQNAYYEAYEMLTGAQKKSILELAAMAERYGFNAGWILGRLLPLSDTSTIPVFLRCITEIDARTSVPQETVGAFLLAIRGFARFHDSPPEVPDSAAGDKRAWGVIASVLFWWLQGVDGRDEIAKGWETMSSELMLCVPDILQKIGESQWHLEGEPIQLEKTFPEFLRPILEFCVQRTTEFTSLFNYGGSRDNRVVEKVIHTLEKIGNRKSIAALNSISEHAIYGRDAINAIQSIRSRSTTNLPNISE
jgi:hypothetical protein